ncbi:MAG: NHLP family bacteriocin export ABC transporter peptidase/permease/ATPase subunit [Treponema sp.]|nr:NHLP family bacteriocin export ABC transporter peptidase/permease/ATPase subunit [Treponema sp.]
MKVFPINTRQKTPTILQMEAVECGAASLAMILGYHGSFIPLERLRVECGVSRDGSKASKIVLAARRLGLEANGYKRDIDGLKDATFPAIIFWDFNHFVVLEGFKGGKAYINDPGSGRRTVTYDEFDSSYTGVILEFSKGENFVKQGKKPSIFTALRRRVEGMESVLLYVVLLGLFLLVPGFVVPAFSRFFVDSILVAKLNGFLKPLLIAMGLAALLTGAITWLQQWILTRFHIKLALSSSAKFLNHVLKMPVEFFAQRMPGEICNRLLSNDVVAALISTKLTGAAVNLICVVFYGILMLRYDVPLTLLCVGTLAINFFVLWLTSEHVKLGTFKAQMELGKLYGHTMSGISMIETLKASGLENDFFQQWSGQQAKVVLQNQKMSRLSQAVAQLPLSLAQMLNLLVLSVGALRVMHGDLTIGMLVAFQVLQGSFMAPVTQFLQIAKEIQSSQADMSRLDDVMDYPVQKRYKDDFENDAQNQQPRESVKKLEGYVSLKNVTFGYDKLSPPLIENLNLELKPGSRVALVGGSGSGKSTIGKLVSSLYTPWSGEILFDGKKISEIERSQFNASVAVVDQDIFLFEGTIRDNLTMWNSNEMDEAAYIQAAKDACIHDNIAGRPGGYFSKVEEGGKNFSGGQRQRLEIARALAGNPRILILDEATSALDPITELIVDQNIRRRGCACVIIAHRLSTIRDCDEIIVLDRGKIMQRGTHDQLVKQKGLYQELIKTM